MTGVVVTKGAPTEEELAALLVVLLSAAEGRQETSAEPSPPAAHPRWRNRRTVHSGWGPQRRVWSLRAIPWTSA